MRIAIDGRELCGRPTGVGRYLAQTLRAWSMLPRAATHEFVVCAPGRVDLTPYNDLPVTLLFEPGSGTAWEQWSLPALLSKARADVLLAPAYTAPLRSPVPTVLVIHDVSFAAHPEWFSWREGARRRTIARLSAERAARVLTGSEFSRREIAAHLGLAMDRITVIPYGVTPLARRTTRNTTRVAVLFVGSIFNRRHVPELIDGFARLAGRRADVELDIVGDNRTSPRIDLELRIRQLALAGRIRLRAYVDEEELGRLYGEARAFVFLSEYEGFGLTPLEALAAGIPIVVLDTVVSREVYGNAAVFLSKADPALIESALECVLFDEAERQRILDASNNVLGRYSWSTASARLLDELLSAGQHHALAAGTT